MSSVYFTASATPQSSPRKPGPSKTILDQWSDGFIIKSSQLQDEVNESEGLKPNYELPPFTPQSYDEWRLQVETTEDELLRTYMIDCEEVWELRDPTTVMKRLDAEHLGRTVKSQLLNTRLLHAAQCVTQFIFDPSIHPNVQQYIKKYVLNIAVLSHGSYGEASIADLKAAPDFYIIKTALKDVTIPSLKHEGVVGLFGTNQLRQYTPNFAYVYGLYLGETTPRLIYEHVGTGMTLRNYCTTCSSREFVLIYLQCLLGIQLGYEEIDFTHYDLHSSNVIVHRENQAKLTIEYILNDKTVYLESAGMIATFIDYGMAHCKFTYMGNKYNVGQVSGYRLVQAGALPDVSHPLYDAYKLLGSCLNAMFGAKNTAFDEVLPLLKQLFPDQHPTFPKAKGEYYHYTGARIDATGEPLDIANTNTIEQVTEFLINLGGSDPLSHVPRSSTLDCDQSCVYFDDVIN